MKLTARTELAEAPANNDLVHIVDVSDTSDNASGSSKKIQVSNLQNGLYKAGGTDVAVADGGTGASTASGARTNLGLVIGTDVQAQGPTLASLEGLSLAAGDVIYATAADTLARLAKGNAGEVLTMNGGATAPQWVAGSSGGQTLYNKIVAPTGGTHTTLQAALDAASSGDTIFVRTGTYAFTANKTYANTLNNITIVGENPNSSIIDLATFTLTLQGTDINFLNVGITSSTGKVSYQGNEGSVVNCNLSITGIGIGGIVVGTSTARYLKIQGNLIECSAASTGFIQTAGPYANVANNLVVSSSNNATTNQGFITNSGQAGNISNNTLTITGFDSSGDYPFIYNSGTLTSIVGNTIYPGSPLRMVGIKSAAACLIDGNFMYDCYDGIRTTASSSCQITNNFIGEVRSGGNPIYCGSATSIITGNMISNPAGSGTQITLVAADRCTISSNKINGGDVGIGLDTNTKYTCITGNHIDITSGFGQGISDSGGRSTITGNVFFIAGGSDGTYGVFSGADYGNVTGNTFTSSSAGNGNGVYLTSAATGWAIGNNVFTNVYTGVTVLADYHMINGNVINDAASIPITITGEKATCINNIIYDGESTSSPVEETKVMRLKNTSGSTIAQGAVVTLKAVAAGNEITTTTTPGDSKIYGMAVESITNNAFGFVKVSGKTVLMKVNGTTDIAIGDFISAYSVAGIGQKASAGHTAIAIALEAYATDDSSGVIDALIIPARTV